MARPYPEYWMVLLKDEKEFNTRIKEIQTEDPEHPWHIQQFQFTISEGFHILLVR